MRMRAQPSYADATRILLQELCDRHGIIPAPRLEWSRRMVSALGKAFVASDAIRLSEWLSQEQAGHTLRHELAHIAAGRQGARRAHGRLWQAWALRLGATPRAVAETTPALAPDRRSKRLAWGLECLGCGVRIARLRLIDGLYHVACGPHTGRLKRAVRAPLPQVLDWVAAPDGARSGSL